MGEPFQQQQLLVEPEGRDEATGSNDMQSYQLDTMIDDQEFEIPPVQNLPTLESIMNAPDDDQLNPQNNFLPDELTPPQDYCEVGSTSSQESSSNLPNSKSKLPKEKILPSEKHGIIFRHVKLKSVSSQLLSAADKVDAGLPTALAVSSMIAVGTSHGLVLVFDPKQVLRWCLGSTAVGAQYGAVSALSFNVDCTRLLCGFAQGQITMWNLVNGKLLRTVLDAHPPGTAILHVKFTDDRTVAVTSDSGGSVFQLEFKRVMGVRTCESQCLFSGSRGEACVIEPLCTQQAVPEHPMKDVVVLAMASLSKVLVVVIKPHLKVHYVHLLLGDSATLPLLSWQYVVIQVSESNRIIDPVLAFARDRTIYFAQVICHGVDDIKITLLQQSELPYKLLAVTWINSRTMVLIDTSERAHLVDVKTEEEIQVLDLADVQLVYSTSFYKSLATGGNVSRALAYAGDRACYQSVITFNNQLILLGTRGVHVLTLRSWSERINALVRHDKYQQSLDLGLAFYKGEGKAVVGLSLNPAKRKLVVDELMKDILMQYVDASLTALCPNRGKIDELENHYEDVIKTSVRYCIATNNSDFLFGIIYDRYSQEQVAKEVFLESLEPFILDGSLYYITPVIMQSFIEHYKNKGMLASVEECIFHLDISSLDIHQVVSLCWSHGLYDVLFHIYNKGMGDYVTPLVELLTRLNTFVGAGKQLTNEQAQLGNKILVYISCCLAGHAYPFGEIPEEKVSHVREQVLLCVTSLHTPHLSDEPVYPYLRTLILFDTREFFNVLSLAFQDSRLQAQEKQRVVDILLLLMVENVGFNPSQIGMLFVFLARQMSQPNSEIVVKSHLFEQVLESLCTSDRSRHEEREQIMLDLLRTGVLEGFYDSKGKDELRLVSMAEAAGFFRVVEMLHIKQRRYHLVLPCYWKDAARKHKIFSFLQIILNDKSVKYEEKELLRKEVMDNLEQFVKIDAGRTAKLILGGFGAGMIDVVARLSDKEEILFEFLQGVFEYLENYVKDGRVDHKKFIKIDAHLYEKYVELMCKFRVPHVAIIEFLKKHSTYRIDVVLSVSKQYGARETTCYLLEKAGDLFGAFSLYVEMLQIAMDRNKQKAVQTRSFDMLEFLQRNSKSMTTEQTHKFWFELLDLVLNKQQQLKGDKQIPNREDDDELTNEWMRGMTSHIMTSGMPYLPPSLILQKIVSSPAYASGRFSELRGLITNMMETCDYEQVLMKTCANMVGRDLLDRMGHMLKISSKAVSLGKGYSCSICSKDMLYSSLDSSSENNSIVCFQCGHGCHNSCMLSLSSSEGSDSNPNKYKCCSCNKTNMTFDQHKQPSHSSLISRNSPDDLKDETLNQDVSLKNFFQQQRTPSHMTTLSDLKKNVSTPKQNRHNFFQSNKWLSLKLAAPSANKS